MNYLDTIEGEVKFPAYMKPIHPSMLRRSRFHDYKSKCLYLITIKTKKCFGPLSVLLPPSGKNNKATVKLTEIGAIIDFNLRHLSELNKDVSCISHIIMPDHIHFILYVENRIEKGLSFFITQFMGKCSRSFWNANPDCRESRQKIGLFEKGYNDKIVNKRGQLHTFKNYIEDNPHRLWIAINNKEFFFKTLQLEIDEYYHDCYGNFLLLDNPIKSAVVYSSKYTPSQKDKLYNKWRETFRQGGVLIGAFIHEEEKKIKDATLRSGGRIIQIMDYGFPERYKPNGFDIEYCAKGQLLQIGLRPYSTRKEKLNRETCLKMNDLARRIEEIKLSSTMLR